MTESGPGRSRRSVLAGLGATLGLSLFPSSLENVALNPKPEVSPAQTPPPEHGQLVTVKSILDQVIPEEYLNNINRTMAGKKGVLVSKKYNRFFLFNGGQTFIHTGVAMHANPNHTANNNLGHANTPTSDPLRPYSINRIYGRNYTSNESRDAGGRREKMYYPMFYDFNGRAIHGIETSISKTGEEEIRYNNSHGCINTTINDAYQIQQTFFPTGKIKRGQATPIVVIID